MFAALSSFLPTSLALNDKEKDRQKPETQQQQPPASPSTGQDVLSSTTVRPATTRADSSDPAIPRPRKPKQEKPLSESYIIVRPPPAKNNHPLNLQIQLLPPRQPHTASRTAQRQSGDFSNDGNESTPTTPRSDDADLRRVASVRSTYSDRSAGFYSSSSSVGSVGSFASTTPASAGGGGGARRIVPLYNLSAHNVLTNTVTDAGTDAKVAKFQKRGLEIIRVGTWEPVEVWSMRGGAHTPPPEPSPGMLPRPSTLTSGGNELNADLFIREEPGTTPTPSNRLRVPPPQFLESLSRDLPNAPPSSNSAKKFFGKVFSSSKKRDPGSPSSPGFLTSPSSTRTTFGIRDSRRLSAAPSISIPLSPSPSIISGQSQTSAAPSNEPLLQPPILGLQAALHSSIHGQPTGRPTTYVWVLRKWSREKQLNNDSIFRGLAAGISGLSNLANQGLTGNGGTGSGSSSIGREDPGSIGEVEVRFEWARGKSASRERSRAPAAARRASIIEGIVAEEDMDNVSSNHSKTSLGHHNGGGGIGSLAVPQGSARSRKSMVPSERSVSPQRTSTSREDEGDDGDDDSDPEDSETPWTCTLHIYPSHLSPLSDHDMKERMASSPGTVPQDGRLRLRLANLLPTPHHPKILGQIKMPFPLPDVAITPRNPTTVNPAPSSPFTPTASSPTGRTHGPQSQSQRKRYEGGVGARFLPRTLSPDGSILHARQAQINMTTEILLTAEDIKDVVSSTGLWLVVREGFGGLGRTKRKGDGWHIRA